MTTRYPGGLIRKTPPTITPPVDGEGGSAPGVWTLEQASYYTKQGTWPLPLISGALYTWGSGGNGRTGQNDTVARSSPTQVGSGSDWKFASTGSGTTAIVKVDGTLWTCGSNSVGQLGQNNVILRSSPTQVGALTNWSKVATAGTSMLGLKTDGTIWSWGQNNTGVLGQNDLVVRSSPTQIGSDANWATIASEQDASFLAIKTTGTLWVWGENSYGQLGLDDRISRSSPVQVGALTNWAYVQGRSDNWFLATKTDGTLWAWGTNTYGELAQNNQVARSSPVQIGALTNWSKFATTSNTAIAIKTDGTMWSWGDNAAGELGLNLAVNVYRSSPVQIGTLNTWLNVNAGNRSVLALKTDGTLWAWGTNSSGQLGLGDVVARSSPVQIGSSTSWVSGFSIFSHAAAISR